MYKYLTIALLFLSVVACKKDKSPNFDNYVKGDLITGIKKGVPLEDAFTLFNTNGLKIQSIHMLYTVSQPEEKIDSITAYLNKKPYVDSVNWRVKFNYDYKGEKLSYSARFFNMGINEQKDWIQTAKDLNLTLDEDNYPVAFLRVPIGTEEYWARTLSENPLIDWAEVNAIFDSVR